MAAAKLKTKLSTKGQVILPAAVRERRGWKPGVVLQVTETPNGVLLSVAEPLFPPTTPEEVFGSLRYDGPRIEIDQAIADEVAERHARGRY